MPLSSLPVYTKLIFKTAQLDQLAALRFIKRNVAAIGGDPSRIIISGHGAGSTSVNMHMLFADPKEHLFTGVLATGCTANSHYMPDVDFWIPAFDALTANISCPNRTVAFESRLDCVKNADFESLRIANAEATHFNPSVHPQGYIRKFPKDAVKAGEIANPVPLISGLKLDEGTTQHGSPDYDDLNMAEQIASAFSPFVAKTC